MTPTYATPAELAAYIEPDATDPAPPANATVLLRMASELVRDATASAVYVTDGNGMPTHLDTLTAFKAATMEQAQAWSLRDLDPRLGPDQVPRRVASKGLGGATVSYVADPAADTYLSDLASGKSLTLQAFNILRNAGLISARVQTGYDSHEVFNVAQRSYDPVSGSYTE